MWNATGIKKKQNEYVEHSKERDQWGNLQNFVKIFDPTEEKKKIVIAKIKNPTVKIKPYKFGKDGKVDKERLINIKSCIQNF